MILMSLASESLTPFKMKNHHPCIQDLWTLSIMNIKHHRNCPSHKAQDGKHGYGYHPKHVPTGHASRRLLTFFLSKVSQFRVDDF
jgi:hypothetical protein